MPEPTTATRAKQLARSSRRKLDRASQLRAEGVDDVLAALELAQSSEGVTVDEIAKLAGMTRENLYALRARRR